MTTSHAVRHLLDLGTGELQAERILNVPSHPQLQSNWCWAACVQMVTEYRRVPMTQCQAANRFLGRNDCCPDRPACNVTMTASESVIFYRGLGNANVADVDAPLSMSDIQRFINNDVLMEAGLYWRRGGAHDVLVHGWSQDGSGNNLVYVNDPADGPLLVTYNSLRRAYGYGDWLETVYGM